MEAFGLILAFEISLCKVFWNIGYWIVCNWVVGINNVNTLHVGFIFV